jgi:hypothetical protein
MWAPGKMKLDASSVVTFVFASCIIAIFYLLYRDIQMVAQIVTDLREEFMMQQLEKKEEDAFATQEGFSEEEALDEEACEDEALEAKSNA